MKIIIKSLLVTVLLGSGIVSCSNDDIPESNTNSTNTINKELFTLADKFEEYFVDARFSTATRSGDSTQDLNEDVLANMDEELADFCRKHDVFADLTETQKNNLRMSEDSMELMRLDPEVYLEYAKEHKSEAYYNILYQIFKKRRTDFYSDDIINNKELYLNEKIHILMVLPALHSTMNVSLTRATTSKSSSKESAAKQQACLKEYEDAKFWCMMKYLGQTGLSLLGAETGWITIAGCAWAYQDYFACEKDANYHYKMCLKY